MRALSWLVAIAAAAAIPASAQAPAQLQPTKPTAAVLPPSPVPATSTPANIRAFINLINKSYPGVCHLHSFYLELVYGKTPGGRFLLMPNRFCVQFQIDLI